MTYLRRLMMNKVFLLGHLYDELTEEQIEYRLKNVTKFERTKNIYLNEVYNNNDSKMVLWNLYKQNILYYEKNLNKDVCKFTVLELDALISSIASNSVNIKANIFSFCNQYIEWCITKKLISINNMNALDRDIYTSISQKLASSKLIGYNEFWKMIDYMKIRTDVQNLVPIVLSYYCINGTDMIWLRTLKLADIDRDNKVVIINDGEVVIPVDDRLIVFIDEVEEDAEEREDLLKTDLIVKPTVNSVNEVMAENTVYHRIYKAFDESGIKRLRLNDLAKSRKIWLLLQIREQRKLTKGDFQRVCEMLNPNVSGSIHDSLVKYYYMSTKDTVYKKHTKDEELIDTKAKAHTNKIKEMLGWS